MATVGRTARDQGSAKASDPEYGPWPNATRLIPDCWREAVESSWRAAPVTTAAFGPTGTDEHAPTGGVPHVAEEKE